MRASQWMISVVLVGALAACGGQVPNNGEATESDLELSYVSGHLGSYWDCPGEASGPPLPSASFAAGDCDGDGCGMLNCENAEVTLQVRNLGDTVAQSIDVISVLLLVNSESDPEDLEILSWSVMPTDALDDGLAPHEVVSIRIQFRGPNPASITGSMQYIEALPVHISVEDDQGSTIELTTPPLDILSIMVT